MIVAKIATITMLVSGSGLALAQMTPIEAGEKMKDWPITVILAVIILASMGVLMFCLRNIFAIMSKNTEAMASAAASINELNARLNVRPCLKDK